MSAPLLHTSSLFDLPDFEDEPVTIPGVGIRRNRLPDRRQQPQEQPAGWHDIVPGSRMNDGVAAVDAAEPSEKQDYAHLSHASAPVPGKLEVAKSKTAVKALAMQMQQGSAEPETSKKPRSPTSAKGKPMLSIAKQLFGLDGAPGTASPPAPAPIPTASSSRRFPTVQPAGGIIGGVVFSSSSQQVARPVVSSPPMASAGASSLPAAMEAPPGPLPLSPTPSAAAAVPMAALLGKGRPGAATPPLSSPPRRPSVSFSDVSDDEQQPTVAKQAVQQAEAKAEAKAADAEAEAESEADTDAQTEVDDDASDEEGTLPALPPHSDALVRSPPPLHAPTPAIAASWLRAREREGSCIDKCARSPKEMWDALDELIFGKIWADRPWAPLPGGASHLRYKPKVQVAVSPPKARGFEGTRWGERGLRWKRIDEIELERGHDLPPPAPADAAGGGSSSSSSDAARASSRRGGNKPTGTKFEMTRELFELFDDPGSLCSLKVTITDERFTLVRKLYGSGNDFVGNFARMRESFLREGEACYVLFRGGEDVWALFSFVSDDAPVRQKMMYSWGRATLVSLLGGHERIPWHDHWNSLSEVELPSEEQPSGGGGGGGGGADGEEYFDAMTEVERQLIAGEREARAEAEARHQAGKKQGTKPAASTGLKFPLTAEASAALDAFKAGTLGAVVVAIEREKFVLRSKVAPGTAPNSLRAHVPHEPCYCLYRWAHEREGAKAVATLFLYMRPEEAPIRAKMLHASSKGPFLASLTASGLEVTKAIEGLEEHELTAAGLSNELYVYNVEPEDEAPPPPPGVNPKRAPSEKPAKTQKMKRGVSRAAGGLHA